MPHLLVELVETYPFKSFPPPQPNGAGRTGGAAAPEAEPAREDMAARVGQARAGQAASWIHALIDFVPRLCAGNVERRGSAAAGSPTYVDVHLRQLLQSHTRKLAPRPRPRPLSPTFLRRRRILPRGGHSRASVLAIVWSRGPTQAPLSCLLTAQPALPATPGPHPDDCGKLRQGAVGRAAVPAGGAAAGRQRRPRAGAIVMAASAGGCPARAVP